ncbi:MAG TPA: hypothetical protein VEL47_01180 [Myxococcota bacterium]|nr:hypothetical protein [Myxococcota bacterium]
MMLINRLGKALYFLSMAIAFSGSLTAANVCEFDVFYAGQRYQAIFETEKIPEILTIGIDVSDDTHPSSRELIFTLHLDHALASRKKDATIYPGTISATWEDIPVNIYCRPKDKGFTESQNLKTQAKPPCVKDNCKKLKYGPKALLSTSAI